MSDVETRYEIYPVEVTDYLNGLPVQVIRYRWRAVAVENGQVVAMGTQAYSRRIDIEEMLAKRFQRGMDTIVHLDKHGNEGEVVPLGGDHDGILTTPEYTSPVEVVDWHHEGD